MTPEHTAALLMTGLYLMIALLFGAAHRAGKMSRQSVEFNGAGLFVILLILIGTVYGAGYERFLIGLGVGTTLGGSIVAVVGGFGAICWAGAKLMKLLTGAAERRDR